MHPREGVGVRVRVLEANVRERVLVPDVVLETTVRVRERVLVPDVVRVVVPVVLRVGVRDCDGCANALKGKKAASSASSTARRGIFSFCARGGGQGENAEQTDGEESKKKKRRLPQ